MYVYIYMCVYIRGDRKLVDNLSHKSNVTSLQDLFTSRH